MADTLAGASLDQLERRTIERFVGLLKDRLGNELIAVWLYGSRARGEPPHDESDVDLIVITRGGDADRQAVHETMWRAATEEGASPPWYSTQVFDPEYIGERREIRSFYLQEVDRDKIVLYGSAL